MLNYNRIAYELDTLGTPSEQHGGDTPQATQYTNITMLQHFDYPESIAYEGNAGLSNVAKFGKACAHFRDSNSYVSLTNTTGVFNLSANGSAEAECFVKTAQGSGSGYNSNLTEFLETDLLSAGYSVYNGHVFKLYTTGKTWPEAQTACEALGGHLATSTSAEKNTFLTTLTTNSAWIGGTDEAEEGVWQWVTGEEWNYTNWASGQPDNANSAEPYLEINFGGDAVGTWNDNSASITHCYICEWDSLDSAIPNILNDYGYKFYNGHTFKYFSDTKTWTDAKAFCEELGGHLATSTSTEKQAFIETLTNSNACWLGGQKVSNTWQWITGETWDYTNWDNGEPNDTASDGMVTQIYASGKWDDTDVYNSKKFICEWDYDIRERAGSGVSSGNILCLSDNSNVISTSDAETQGYKFYNGHTFKYFSDNVLWPEAKAACEALGGHLATSTSAEKNTFLTTVSTNVVWLGAIDENKNDNWEWVTGEEWEYTNWASGDPNNLEEQYLMMNYSEMGKWYDETVTHTRAYICEWDYDIREPKQLTLSIGNDGTLNLKSAIWALDETSTLTLEPDTWYHVLLRLSEGTASVYLNGAQALSGSVSGEDITPQSLTLGGYVGYMDEFVFRDGAGTGAPTVPTSAYETGTGTVVTSNTAPVTRAVWTCEDLPEGLTLSSSGVLSGHPTTAGTYDCNVSVATNWGTATKTIRIVVNNV